MPKPYRNITARHSEQGQKLAVELGTIQKRLDDHLEGVAMLRSQRADKIREMVDCGISLSDIGAIARISRAAVQQIAANTAGQRPIEDSEGKVD